MKRSWNLLLVLVSLGGALGATQGPAAPTQDEATPPSVQQRWQQMNESERAALQRNWQRWKAMSEGDQEELRSRHDRFRRWQQHVDRRLAPEERRRLAPLPQGERRHEMARLTRERLDDFLQSVPDELRPSISRELRRLGPRERHRRFQELVREEGDRRFAEVLDEIQQAGRLDAPRAARVRRHFEQGSSRERLHTLQRLANLHPDGLQISRSLLEGLGEVDDPVEALSRVNAHRVPELSLRETERLLAGAGVPEVDRRRWARLPADQRPRSLQRLMRQYHVLPPTAMARHLQQLGVEPSEVRGALRSSNQVEALRALYRRYGHTELDEEDYWRRARRPPRAPR